MSEPIVSEHPKYGDAKEFITKMRDSFEGTKKIKEAGELHLLKPAGYKDYEYEAYKHRAEYLPTVQRTHAGLIGRAFNENPEVDDAGLDLDSLDIDGLKWPRLLRWVVSEVLLVDYCGLLVDFDDSPRIARYKADDIIDWHFSKGELDYLVLNESDIEFDGGARKYVQEHRVFSFDENGNVYSQVFTKENEHGRTVEGEVIYPQIFGKYLDFIPFGFIGNPAECVSSLSAIAELALQYYDRSAMYNWALSKVASPQFTIEWDKEVSFDDAKQFLEISGTDGDLQIGSSSVLQLYGAKASYVEISGSGLDKIHQNQLDIKSQMIAAGARALADQSQSNVAAETVRIMNSGEGAVLSEIVSAISADASKVLQMAARFGGISKEPSVKFSKNFFNEKVSPAELLQMVSSWQQGGIPLEVVYNYVKTAGLTEDDFDVYEGKLNKGFV